MIPDHSEGVRNIGPRYLFSNTCSLFQPSSLVDLPEHRSTPEKLYLSVLNEPKSELVEEAPDN
jgi:hypothetical protein